MKLIALFLIVFALVAAIIGPQLIFIVDESKVAIVTRFGEIIKTHRTPGLFVKTPFVDRVTYFEKRLLIFDAPPDSLLTKDKKRLIIDVYARGRIVDPQLFRETLRTESQATSRAVDIISSELRREIASDNQAEIITTERDTIMDRVLANVSPKLQSFGIEVIDVRIKRADFPPEIADSVYARMQAERKRKADKERAEGAEVDARVRADVDKKASIIAANAERDASIIRGCGEAEAIRVFAQALEEDPEFYTFQRSLEAYAKFLSSNTTLVMPVDGFGRIFDDIRQGVINGTRTVDELTDVGVSTLSRDSENLGASCAKVAATRYLSMELKIDQGDVRVVDLKPMEWNDSTLGCKEDSQSLGDGPISGFKIVTAHNEKQYEIHTNRYGSEVAICS